MISKQLTGASSIPIILSILKEKENYGYQIIKRVKEVSDGNINWSEPMLYPVLHRLENEEFIKSEWKQLPNGRKRKYYSITPKGKKLMMEQKSEWVEVIRVFNKIWKINPSGI